MRNLAQNWHKNRQSIAFVPTMGFLHAGHVSLIKKAREQGQKVIVSIFVNPLQFGVNEDFSTYPRALAADIKLCQAENVDVIFCPDTASMFPRSFSTRITAGALGKIYCGKTRPVFFDGVLTVVHALFQIIKPDLAYFGEKDFQQLFLIKKMCQDFWLQTKIIAMPIIRESTGLAMSSRNSYLDTNQKEHACNIFNAICRVQETTKLGNRQTHLLRALATNMINQTPGMKVDYVHLVDLKTLEPVGDELTKPAQILIAAYVDNNPPVRLIDNGLILCQ